jgi:hypothetical protein
MHASKLPLTRWFWAAFLMATQSNSLPRRRPGGATLVCWLDEAVSKRGCLTISETFTHILVRSATQEGLNVFTLIKLIKNENGVSAFKN